MKVVSESQNRFLMQGHRPAQGPLSCCDADMQHGPLLAWECGWGSYCVEPGARRRLPLQVQKWQYCLLRDRLQPDAAVAALLRRKKAADDTNCGTTVNKYWSSHQNLHANRDWVRGKAGRTSWSGSLLHKKTLGFIESIYCNPVLHFSRLNCYKDTQVT